MVEAYYSFFALGSQIYILYISYYNIQNRYMLGDIDGGGTDSVIYPIDCKKEYRSAYSVAETTSPNILDIVHALAGGTSLYS